MGAQVIMACRSLERANEAIEDIKATLRADSPDFNPELLAMELDLSDLNSIQSFVNAFKERFQQLDVLINNAGVSLGNYEKTAQGLEMMFGVNHIGHFYLTHLLLDLLIETPSSRIVVVASEAHRLESDLHKANKPPSNGTSFGLRQALCLYGLTKAFNILFAYELNRRLQEAGISNVTVNSLHPGAVNTDLSRHMPSWISWIVGPIMKLFFKSPSRGAECSVYLASSPEVNEVTGKYFDHDTTEKVTEPYTNDPENWKWAWDYSIDIIKESMGEDALKNALLK